MIIEKNKEKKYNKKMQWNIKSLEMFIMKKKIQMNLISA